MTALSCRTCGAPFSEDGIEQSSLRADGLVTCPYCATVTRVGHSTKQHDAFRKRAPVAMPPRMHLEETDARMRIVRRWFQPAYFALVAFCFFWDGFLIVWYANVLRFGSVTAFFFPLVHVAVGCGLTYWTFASLINTTTIDVGDRRLQIRHGPVPWPGERLLPVTDVEQFFTEEKVNRTKNGESRSYTLSVKLRNGNRVELIKGMSNAEEALFTEQQIERRLRIADAAVFGEYPRE